MTGSRKIENFDWNPESIEQLKKLWDEGHSTSSIAVQMSIPTKNAVVGKANRLGLKPRKKKTPPRAASIVRSRETRKSPFVKPLLASIPAPQLPSRSLEAPKGTLIPFMKMTYRTCRSVEGHEMVGPHRMALYCNNPKADEQSFCPYHQSIYYRQDVKR